MKNFKKRYIFCIINYLILFICGIYVLISHSGFLKFINKYLTLTISINAILLIFFYIILKNVNVCEKRIDISIPPIESELKDLLNNQTEDELEDEAFREVNFKNLNN